MKNSTAPKVFVITIPTKHLNNTATAATENIVVETMKISVPPFSEISMAMVVYWFALEIDRSGPAESQPGI
jgi:hypothetical protein